MSKKHKEAEVRYHAAQAKKRAEDGDTEDVTKVPTNQPTRIRRVTESEDPENNGEEDGSGDEEEEEEEDGMGSVSTLTLNDCLFCSTSSEDLATNMEHMSATHGFFIPDLDSLEDLQGLIKYLQEKVAKFFVCLTCNGKGRAFHSLSAVRKHMIDKGHCQMDNTEDGVLELSEYYNVEW